MRYNESNDCILKNVSFKINPGEKIGCIGRTVNKFRIILINQNNLFKYV